ncbi:hypothetical protein H0X32_01600 [Patescibacteria group bacterium]|nr:hypothetical protein [Patescibacteria group bacterium]
MSVPITLAAFKDNFPFSGVLEEQMTYVLNAATRAPSTHNSQPWLFKIHKERLSVYRDTSILLPYSDSVGRYSYVSIGFLLHHISSITAFFGMSTHFTIDATGDHIADITFELSTGTIDETYESLIRAIFTRRNRRGLFNPNVEIPEDLLIQLRQPSSLTPHDLRPPEVATLIEKEKIKIVAEQTAKNILRVYALPMFRNEMSYWITPTGSRKRTGLPGYSLNQPVILSWILPTMIRFLNMGPVLSKLNFGAIASSKAVVGFGAEESFIGWLGVGFQASHAALTLCAQGFDYSVFVASVEYEDTRAAATVAFTLQSPLQFLFAAGKIDGEVDWMTPRIPLKDKLRRS